MRTWRYPSPRAEAPETAARRKGAVTVVNPVLHSKHRSAALSPDPLPANANFIRLSARDVAECQLSDQIVSPKGARLVKPEMW